MSLVLRNNELVIEVSRPDELTQRWLDDAPALSITSEMHFDDFGDPPAVAAYWHGYLTTRYELQVDEFGPQSPVTKAYAQGWHAAAYSRRAATARELTREVFQFSTVGGGTVTPRRVEGFRLLEDDFIFLRAYLETAELAAASQAPVVAAAVINADFVLSETSIAILRQGMEKRRSDGYTSTLTAQFEAMQQSQDKPFAKAVAEMIEHMIMTIGRAIRDGRWKGEIGSDSRFSSPMGEEFRVRFPLPYDWLPPFMAAVYQDLRSALQRGFKLQGKWGRLHYNPNNDVMEIVLRKPVPDHQNFVVRR